MFRDRDHPAAGAGPLSLAIVGNAPDIGDRGAQIDSCDMVVRFNNAAGFTRASGRRVTHLALVNRGGQPREWLEDEGFTRRSELRAARRVILPFPALDGKEGAGLCHTEALLRRLSPLGLGVEVLDEALHRQARASLREHGAKGAPNPSTGFLVALHMARALPQARIHVFGFGFAGWRGHPWAAERRWFETAHRERRLTLHPLRALA
ncbi:glycosyltransferase family 29 protein [Aureimonas populi]|uniref:Glycosyltransferase family 29 protein n=1 Tax=Aureimonas populi TaxID=1701758 RepID=A0ABW5CHZ1_9HYPH|nr:glycosyltransferase family 29 protein [Aureimonas populi]